MSSPLLRTGWTTPLSKQRSVKAGQKGLADKVCSWAWTTVFTSKKLSTCFGAKPCASKCIKVVHLLAPDPRTLQVARLKIWQQQQSIKPIKSIKKSWNSSVWHPFEVASDQRGLGRSAKAATVGRFQPWQYVQFRGKRQQNEFASSTPWTLDLLQANWHFGKDPDCQDRETSKIWFRPVMYTLEGIPQFFSPQSMHGAGVAHL